MPDISKLRGKVPAEVESKVEERVKAFKENHEHPANKAMHAVGILAIVIGAVRILRGHVISGITLIAAGVGLILGGHQLEGSSAFSLLRDKSEENGAAS